MFFVCIYFLCAFSFYPFPFSLSVPFSPLLYSFPLSFPLLPSLFLSFASLVEFPLSLLFHSHYFHSALFLHLSSLILLPFTPIQYSASSSFTTLSSSYSLRSPLPSSPLPYPIPPCSIPDTKTAELITYTRILSKLLPRRPVLSDGTVQWMECTASKNLNAFLSHFFFFSVGRMRRLAVYPPPCC